MTAPKPQGGALQRFNPSNRHEDCMEPAADGDYVLFADIAQSAPSAHQGEVTVTWDAGRTRILAVTRQDDEGRILSVIAEAPTAPQQAGDGLMVTDDMVSRFLGWRLPDDFYPDCGVSFKPPMHEGKPLSWPTGTNLLHAGQARQMLEHVLAAPRQPTTFDTEALIRACVPGGSICDPQQVADAIRAYVAPRQPGEVGAGVPTHIQMTDGRWVPYEQVVSVAEWPAEEFAWQVEVAGPAGYVRFVDFKSSCLQDLLQDISAQGYAPAPDEDGFVTMKVKV